MAYSSADPNSFLAVGMQSGLGTPQTTLAKLRYLKYLSGTGYQAQLEVVNLREGGDGLDYGFSYKKSQKVAGQIVVNARPESIGQLLQLLPGGATWSGASAPAVHTFHTGHASFPYTTIFSLFPGSAIPQMLSDVRFTGFDIEAVSGEPWKLTFPFTGIQHGASFNQTLAVPSYAFEDPFLYQNSPTVVLDGAAPSGVTGWKISHGLGVEELQALSVQLDDIVVMNRDITIEITRRFEDPTGWKKIAMGAAVSPTTSVATGSFRADSLYGAAGTLRSVSVNAPLLNYEGDDLGELDPDGKTVIETITAQVMKAATSALQIVVNNAHASAYA